MVSVKHGRGKGILSIIFMISALIGLSQCNRVNDDRIPALTVNINLGDPAVWNAYGVSGFGIYRMFILDEHKPAGFPYNARSATGFGGVLLIGGMDPFTTTTDIPLAYDLACPVEQRKDVRVEIDNTTFEAVCRICGSRYDVTMAGGAPCGGPALEGTRRYALRKYNCFPTQYGGYLISN